MFCEKHPNTNQNLKKKIEILIGKRLDSLAHLLAIREIQVETEETNYKIEHFEQSR